MPRFHRPLYSARLHGAMRALEDRRDSARHAAAQLSDPDGYLAASLRGKAAGYQEAVDLLRAIEKGWNLPKRLRWTDRRARATSTATEGPSGGVEVEGSHEYRGNCCQHCSLPEP